MTYRFGILVFPGVQQLDLTGPHEIFAAGTGAEVHLIWKNRAPLPASSGLMLQPTTTFADCPKLDLLCVPGGSGVDVLMEDAETLDFIRARAPDLRYLTSVCTGALVLGAAGLLRGRRAATHWNARHLLAAFGAMPDAGRVVRDGSLVTAGGVTSGIDFGLTVMAEIYGQAEAERIQLYLEYAPAPPFTAGRPEDARPAVLAAAQAALAASRQAREAIVARITSRAD
jgi:cyclohexyl-isocyanide hydratase